MNLEQSHIFELRALAEILADWADQGPFSFVYLFGSRVRGDHRPNSDVDIRLFLDDVGKDASEVTLRWWQDQNETDFADLKRRLPGPLAIHRESEDAADHDIRKGATRPVLVVRKVVCVRTPRTIPRDNGK
jgi:predicted nucleotidyltransferase